jgi:hypothetical protein
MSASTPSRHATRNKEIESRVRSGPSKGHGCTHAHLINFAKKNSNLACEIHGQIRIQIAHIRVLGVRFRTEGGEEKGMAGVPAGSSSPARRPTKNRPRAARRYL